LGVLPPVLAALGAGRLGAPLAERLVLTGQSLDADQALQAGFAAELFTQDQEPQEGTLSWYRKRIKPLSAFSLRQATRALRESSGYLESLRQALDAAERLYLEKLIPSHDGNEGIDAFLEKRQPQWQDR
jgi:enoyl-CoA hydratase